MTNTSHGSSSTQPWLHQEGTQVQEFGTLRQLPVSLSYEARMYSCQRLNQTLADTQVLYSLYKKHHWLMRGATFFQLHELLDKHAKKQLKLIDTLAERVQTLGGVAVGDLRQVAEITVIPRPPDGVEEVPAMLSRLLEAHESILVGARDAATRTAELGDDGTNDLFVSEVIRLNELQAWFLAEHLVETPLVRV
jgi:starvation-inducible DNA-binding protein